MARTASIDRKTAETEIQLSLNLDGTGKSDISTGVGFLDHMLTLFAKHGILDLAVQAREICTSTSTIRWRMWEFVWGRRSSRLWVTSPGFAGTDILRCRWKRPWQP